MWCNISGGAGVEIWNWSPLKWKLLTSTVNLGSGWTKKPFNDYRYFDVPTPKFCIVLPLNFHSVRLWWLQSKCNSNESSHLFGFSWPVCFSSTYDLTISLPRSKITFSQWPLVVTKQGRRILSNNVKLGMLRMICWKPVQRCKPRYNTTISIGLLEAQSVGLLMVKYRIMNDLVVEKYTVGKLNN